MANLFGGPIAGRLVAVQAAGDQQRGTVDARIDHVIGILPPRVLGDQPCLASDFRATPQAGRIAKTKAYSSREPHTFS